MDASEASCSSRNLINDGPPLFYGERRGRESVHESNASASGGSNTPFATVYETRTTSPSNATAAIKLHPTLPRNGFMSVIQSSWIQRLKPFAQSNTPKDEPAKISTKEIPICTHFTKDFSSCSRRLNKPSHHTRSSSWPPHAMRTQRLEHFPLEVGEPAGIAEGYGKAAIISCNIDHQNIQSPSNMITHSSDADSRTGDLFAKQQSRCKQISAIKSFVPNALKRENSALRKLNDSEESECGRDCKPKDWLTQQIQNSGDGHAPLLSVSMYTAAHSSGASADADDRVLFAKPLDCCMGIKTLPHMTSYGKPDCEIAFPIAAVSEGRINIDKAGEAWCPRREITNSGVDARNSGCVQTAKNLKQSKELAKAYLLNNISDTGATNKFCNSSKTSYLATEDFCNAHERVIRTTCAAGSRTVAAPGPLKPDVVSKRLDGFYSRENDFADLQDTHFSEEGRSRLTSPIGSFHEDSARSRIREKSLGDYWNSLARLLEGPDHAKAAQTGGPMAKLQQDYVVGEYHKNLVQPTSSNGRSSAKPKFEDCHSHKHVTDDCKNLGGCNFPQQRLGSSSKSSYKFLDHTMGSSEIKMVDGQERYASADPSSQLNLKGLQSFQKHGATSRVDSQPHNKEADFHRRFLDDGSSYSRMRSPHGNNERTGEEISMHQGWIRRWQSSAKFSAMSGKATAHVPYFSRSLSSDQLVKSNNARAQCPLISNLKAMGSFDHTELGSASSKYMEISGVRLDSGSGSTTPGSPLAGRNFAAFRSGCMGSCAEPMAMVGRSASKPPPKSLQNRGFCGLPCTNPKFEECKVLPKDKKVHSVDFYDLKALEQHIDDS